MDKRFCEQCQKEGKKSVIYEPTHGITTLMGVSPGFFDEEGNYNPPVNPNKTTYEWSCSNGHKWHEVI